MILRVTEEAEKRYDSYFGFGLLSRPNEPLPKGVEIMQDFKLVKILLRVEHPKEGEDWGPLYRVYNHKPYLIGLVGEAWSSIDPNPRELRAAKDGLTLQDLSQSNKLIRKKYIIPYESSRSPSVSGIVAKIPGKGLGRIRGVIENQMRIIFDYICLKRPSNKIIDEMIKVYRAGALPVSWVGDYPEGHIVAYWPHDEEPVYADE